MEKSIGIEDARKKLGELADEVAEGGEPVNLSRRGRVRAVMVGAEEYLAFREASSRAAREELQELLPRVREQVEGEGLDAGLVRRAVEAVRRLS